VQLITGTPVNLFTAAFRRNLGSWTFIGTWILQDGKFEPCLAIIPKNDEKNKEGSPCTILLKEAWRWEEDKGDITYTHYHIARFFRAFRMTPTPQLCNALLRYIHDCLPDLLTMLPEPPEVRQSTVGVSKMTNYDTGHTTEKEIKELHV